MPPVEPGKARQPSGNHDVVLYVGVGAVVLVTAVVGAALRLSGAAESNNLFGNTIRLGFGKLGWTTGSTVWLIVLVIILALLAAGPAWWWQRRRGRKTSTRVDTAQQHLGSGRDIASLTMKANQDKAASLGVDTSRPPAAFSSTIGVPIGQTLGGQPLFASWEDMHLDIWGPRQGKSTSRIIPAICEAPGAVLATENKRGNLDHTRLVREFRDEEGRPTRDVWVFDPQGVANEDPWWYWNPLSYVVDETTAEELAQLFSAGDDAEAAKKDPYFDPEGEDLLANLILASALAGEPITAVYEKLVDRGRCFEAVKVLRTNDYPMIASALEARLNYAPKQQDGIFGTSIKMARSLRSRQIRRWVAPIDEHDDRPTLDIASYIRHGDTLYCLSKEGVGSAGPLVAALTMAVTKTAEKIATASPGGRLPVPMLCALDEAANCVRWPDLPKLYSHFGSRGIIIMTILQSWSQGIGVWGERHMKLLESSSNVYVYGGNVREAGYLDNLVKLVGEYEHFQLNVSRGSSGGASGGGHNNSVARSRTKESIFNPAQLAAWPLGRALVFTAGNPPVIVLTVPWHSKPYAHLVRASLAEFSPDGDHATTKPPTPDTGADNTEGTAHAVR